MFLWTTNLLIFTYSTSFSCVVSSYAWEENKLENINFYIDGFHVNCVPLKDDLYNICIYCFYWFALGSRATISRPITLKMRKLKIYENAFNGIWYQSFVQNSIIRLGVDKAWTKIDACLSFIFNTSDIYRKDLNEFVFQQKSVVFNLNITLIDAKRA